MADQMTKAAEVDQNGNEGGERFEERRPANPLKLDDGVLGITDPLNIQPVCADLLTENRVFGNVICLSFGNIVTDGDGTPEVRVSARIRLTLTTAIDLRNILDELLGVEMPGQGKGKLTVVQ